MFCISFSLNAQFLNPEPGPVFVDDEVPRIDINIDETFIEAIANDPWSNEEYEAQFIFTSSEIKDTLEQVGVRLRGNTSRGAAKKSIKISFNTFKPGRKFYGLEKMNINGEHNDPSIIRSKLAWDLSNWIGVPASRSNHVELFVNGDYLGLYINVEHIDEEFIAKRFEDKNGNLWKCLYPADLNYLGFNPDLYKVESNGRRIYDLKTNKIQDDYSKLAHFIDVLNNYQGEDFKCELERIFDVDNYIKIMALDILIGHWDGPISNMNNFYLYHNPCTDQIQFISYDLDNTFGIDWAGRDFTEISIYNWSNNSFDGGARPIYESIIAVPEYKERFDHYMKEILEDYFNVETLGPYLDNKLALIKDFRIDDPVAGLDYGWSYDDFLESYENGIGDHVQKGMKEYISQRHQNAIEEVNIGSLTPIIQNITIDWSKEELVFKIKGYDDEQIAGINFYHRFDNNEWKEDVLNVDQNSGASYTHQVNQEGIMNYYIEVIDNDGNYRSYPLCKDATVRLGYLESPNLIINEIVSSNTSIAKDEYDEYDDWIELYNASGTVLPIGKLSLSDNPNNPGKWRLPNTALNSKQYLIIWADGDPFQGNQHANFKLKKSGETLGLYDDKDNHFKVINEIEIPEMETDFSFARKPNALGDFMIVDKPTFGFDNDLSSNNEISYSYLQLFPNPAFDLLTIDTDINLDDFQLSCVNAIGQVFPIKRNSNQISIKHLQNGIYSLLIQNNHSMHVKSFMIQKK